MAGAFGEILGDSQGAKCCMFSQKMCRQDGAHGLVRDHECSWTDHGRIRVESSFYWRKQLTDFKIKF